MLTSVFAMAAATAVWCGGIALVAWVDRVCGWGWFDD